MSHDEKNHEGKAGNVGSTDKTRHGGERLVGVPPKTGLESGRVGRKIVGQGKRRETLKKRAKEPD